MSADAPVRRAPAPRTLRRSVLASLAAFALACLGVSCLKDNPVIPSNIIFDPNVPGLWDSIGSGVRKVQVKLYDVSDSSRPLTTWDLPAGPSVRMKGYPLQGGQIVTLEILGEDSNGYLCFHKTYFASNRTWSPTWNVCPEDGKPFFKSETGQAIRISIHDSVPFIARILARGKRLTTSWTFSDPGPPLDTAQTVTDLDKVKDRDSTGAYKLVVKTTWHRFDTPGPYTGTLSASVDDGRVEKLVYTITVLARPPVVEILSPKEGALTNRDSIDVDWVVDGTPQQTLTRELLGTTDGLITISRIAEQGGLADTAWVHVIRDTKAPNPPLVNGPSPTPVQPRWTWASGGGGSGDFQIKVGDGDFSSGAKDTRDSNFTLQGVAISGQDYTLFVREADSAGNWSQPGQLKVAFDATRPSIAIVVPQASGTVYTSSASVALSGRAFGPNPIVKVFYTGGSLTGEAIYATGAWSIASLPLAEGAPLTLSITAQDAIGNKSAEATVIIHRDNTPPAPPVVTDKPTTPTRNAKGTWTWNAGADNADGSGLNGKYRYSLNGGAWTETASNFAANLSLLEGTNVFSLQEQDKAMNWSVPLQSQVKFDTTGPVLAITSHGSNPINLNASRITLQGSVSDAGTDVASVGVSGHATGSGSATITGATWKTAELTLKQGANPLTVTAVDLIGNTATLNLTVNVNVNAPAVNITWPPAEYATNKDTLSLRYTVDNGAETSSAPFNLAEGPNTLIADSPENEFGVKGTASVTVIRDPTPPNAPTVTVSQPQTNGNPIWNWVSNGDNAGGSGTAGVALPYRHQLNGAGAFTSTASTTFALVGAPEGVYSLSVQQQDKAGNWSALGSATVTVDRTPPAVSVFSPAAGLVTSDSGVFLVCKVAGVNQPSKSKLLVDGPNTLTCQAADSAGNMGSASVTVYGASKAIFVNDNANPGDGRSWTTPFNSISAAMSAWKSGKEIWVAAGNYGAPNGNGYEPAAGMAIYGGFPDNGSAYTPGMRAFAAADTSMIDGYFGSLFTVAGVSTSNRKANVILDGFKLHYSSIEYAGHALSLKYTTNVTVRNTRFVHYQGAGIPISATDGGFTAENCAFTGHSFDAPMVNGGGSSASFTHCEFSGNGFSASNTVLVDVSGWASATFSNTLFLDPMVDSSPGSGNHYIRYTDATGTLNVTGCTFKTGNPPAIDVPAGTKGIRTLNSFPP